jgi:carboxymethylenebutenolidase
MKPKLILPALFICAAVSASAQDWAKAKLEKSPRHGEWVTVTNGARPVQCWVVYPEVKDKATAVLLIHEIYGLSDWARAMTDEVAAAGYIAIAPDLLSGLGPKGGGTSELTSQEIGQDIQKLPAAQITGDLNAAADYVKALPAASGKLVVGGFCWGGGQSFLFACNRADLKAAFVFYGSPPSAANMAKIQCPVYGFYGGNDGRITLTVTNTVADMKAAGKSYVPVVYDGAGHGFMRAGEPEFPEALAANRRAYDQAWERWKDSLKRISFIEVDIPNLKANTQSR